MSKDFFSSIKDRRTYYAISKETTLPDEKLKGLIEDAINYTPSAFNSQSSRVILLLGQHHDKLWDITMEALRKIVPAAQFGTTEAKINSFKSGYGTVLYFEDSSVVEGLQQAFPLYKDNFPIWSQQSSGMLQFAVWNTLDIEGLGASLQHYGELIYEDVIKEWNVPKSWKLIGQMPFGKPTANPDEKQFQPIETRFKLYK